MYEHHSKPVISRKAFAARISANIGIAVLLSSVSLGLGMLGYRYLVGLAWIDSFLNASMILGGMGPVDAVKTDGGKLFAGCFALFSGLWVIIMMGLILAPVFHRILHRFHTKNPD
jgi:hypothetical protein